MAYTPAVPQGNQTIAATQAPILTNFTFLQTAIGQDHNFDVTGSGSNCYHNKASMPNIVTPVALPAGTNGIYFVKNNSPKFTNAASVSQSKEFNIVSSYPGGASYLTSVGSVDIGTTFITLATLPANSFGSFWISRVDQHTFHEIGNWNTSSTTLDISVINEAGYRVLASGLDFQARGTAAYGANTIWGFQIITP